MTGLKDAYRSGEDNHLGKTGQVRMEFNVVTAPVGKALVIYATVNPAQTRPTIFVTDCEDTLNTLKRPKLRATITEDKRENLAAKTVTRRDTWPGIAGDRRGIEYVMVP